MNKNKNVIINQKILNKVCNISTGEYEQEENREDLMDYKVEHILDMFCRNLEDTKQELKGYFTKEEALEIVSCFTSTLYNTDTSCKDQLVFAIEGHFKYESPVSCITQEIRETLMKKINKLSSFQVYVVMYLAKEYLLTPMLVDEGNERLKEIFMISK